MLIVVVFNLLLTGTLWQVDPSKRCLKILFSEKERNMRMVSLHFCLYMKICNTYFKRCDRLLNICLAHEMLCVQRAYEHYSLLVIPCIYENILFMYKKNIACIYKKKHFEEMCWLLNLYLAHRMHHKELTNCNRCCTPAFKELLQFRFNFDTLFFLCI